MKPMQVILIAPDFTESEISHKKELSPAAAAWVLNFTSVLRKFATIEASIWFNQLSSWPKDRLIASSDDLYTHERQRHLVRYLNLPLLKRDSIRTALEKEAEKRVSPGADIIIYGQRSVSPSGVRRLRAAANRVFLVVPDAESGRNGLLEIERVARFCDGVICLPYGLHEELKGVSAISYQGYVNSKKMKLLDHPSQRKFVFVGGIDKTSGIKFLRESLELVPSLGRRIRMVGRVADKEEAKRLSELGVEFMGFLSNVEMEKVCEEALAFLNPRDPRDKHSSRNFPSKLLNYMRYGRPIISTNTYGLPPETAKALGCEKVLSPNDFALAIQELTTSTETEIRQRIRQIESLVDTEYGRVAAEKKLREFFFGGACS